MPIPDRRIPISTYRLQFNYSFTFKDAAKLIPYLHDLGITTCYASPYLKALPGSSHGYDVIDPTTINPELGDELAYQQYAQALKDHHIGQILDVVPNHMGIDKSANPWWQDVLENGPSSKNAKIFDINWNPVKSELKNKVLLPILGEQYGIALENQEISLAFTDGQFFLQYYEHHLPIDPSTWSLILAYREESLRESLSPDDPSLQEFQSIITALSHLPSRNENDPERIAVRYREKDVIQRRLATLCEEHQAIDQFLLENIHILNGVKGVHQSFDQLDALVSDQAYRLAYWRVAAEEINYRRFFDINQLAAIRMEESDVFTQFHQCVFGLLRSGAVTGLRIDHIDGLYDPKGYLAQWQSWALKELGLQGDEKHRSIFMVVEKILGTSEALSTDWPCHGTTGYDFLALLNNLFVDTRHAKKFDALYHRFTKTTGAYEDLIYHAKTVIMSSAMSSEINSLGHQLSLLSERNRRSRDFTLNSLVHAVREIIASFPVYRTYATFDPSEEVADRDRIYIHLAAARAKRRNPAISSLVFDFIRDLLLKVPFDESRIDWRDVNSFAMKFQQTTSPVMAKGVEDTVFYTYNRLLSLNEVGGEPEQFGISLSHFYEQMSVRRDTFPHSLSTTATHDTKRGEDVRARLNVLSELPQEWRKRISRWRQLNKKAKSMIDEQSIPDLNEEYFLYQTILGCWPLTEIETDEAREHFSLRIQEYMTKALREAKVHSSWLNPNETYEAATRAFIINILHPKRSRTFLKDFRPFQQKVAQFGMVNSLSQVLIKVTAPGIPDFYQGTELWDFHLVDPDNRRPIHYEDYRQALAHLQAAQHHQERMSFIRELLDHPHNGQIKLWTTTMALNFRKQHASLFMNGQFVPIETEGPRSPHVCAFGRIEEGQAAVTVIPRFISSMNQGPNQWPIGNDLWEESNLVLPPEFTGVQLTNIFTGETLTSTPRHEKAILPLAKVFHHFPIALLERAT